MMKGAVQKKVGLEEKKWAAFYCPQISEDSHQRNEDRVITSRGLPTLWPGASEPTLVPGGTHIAPTL